ncbi:MAG: helix-turn-helix domain-containing protein [Parvularcula sp.]|jgi:AraC family transcriptional regulator|nr:helix-turn-helix domain-containing protein [Parvularcula sp.]
MRDEPPNERMADLFDRMERAVLVMAEKVRDGSTPTLDELASAAAFSRYHFHRAFRLLTSETPGETLRRLRAAHALAELAKGGTVTSAAFQAGYGSSQALAKALKKLGAAPASELKGDPERLGAAFETVEPPRPWEGAKPYLVIEAARTLPFEVLMRRHEGDPAALNGIYTELFERAGGPEGVEAILGFAHGDEGFEPQTPEVFDAAIIPTTQGEAAMGSTPQTTIREGTYVTARIVGNYDDLDQAIDHVVAVALISPGVSLADRPVMLHYLDDPEETAPAQQRADIYVAVTLQP